VRVKGVGDGVLDALPLSYRGMGWVDGDGVGMSARETEMTVSIDFTTFRVGGITMYVKTVSCV
jgi:hypothetical protein